MAQHGLGVCCYITNLQLSHRIAGGLSFALQQLKVQTWKLTLLYRLHFGKSVLLSHGVNEVTHLLHICSYPKASLPQTIALTHGVTDGDASLVAKIMIQY